MSYRSALLSPCLAVLCAATLAAQNSCPDGGVGSEIASFELDAITGNNGHLGVEWLNGELFVSSRGPGAIPPHKIYVFNATGSLLRTFNQPAATNGSAWGMRDLATDGTNLFGGDENGVYGFDAQGNVVTQVIAANGPRPLGNLNGSPADQLLGTFRALAFDRAGNGGQGSFWSANFTSDLVEFDLSGNVLRQVSNNSSWSLYGLARDPCSGSLWGYAQPADGNVFEISTVTGQPTGRELPVSGVAGGLAIYPEPSGVRTWFARIDQTSPDVLRIGVLHQMTGICDGVELFSQIDSGAADRSFKTVDANASNVRIGSMGTPTNAPLALFFNFGADALACGDVTYLGSSWRALSDLVMTFTISQPTGIGIDFTIPSGTPLNLAAAWLPSNAVTPMRVQGVWLDPRVPGAYLPVLATNEVEFSIDRRAPLGIVVEARGTNSFNSDTTRGFFSIRNPSTAAISRVRLEAVDGMVFDFAQLGMADRFDGGNSVAAGCLGTFRNGTAAAVGVDFAATPVSPCDPAAKQAHLETTSFDTVVTFPFAGTAFRNNTVFEWDLDTDGGLGISGAAMAGMKVTIDFVGGDRRVGTLAVDPNIADRAFVIL